MPLIWPLPGTNPPMVMTVEPIDKNGKDQDKVRIEVREVDGNGPLRFLDKADLTSAGSRSRLLNQLGRVAGLPSITDFMLVQLLTDYRTWHAKPTAKAPFSIVLRRRNESDTHGVHIEVAAPGNPAAVQKAIHDAIEERAVAGPDMLLTWPTEYADKLTVLDVDYHDLAQAPDEEFTTALAQAIRPRPLAWWRSHGGGLHLLFIAVPPYQADELAACAAIHVTTIDPSASIELLCHTRHPRSGRLPPR